MPRKSYDEQIASIEEKLKVQQARLKEVKARQKHEEKEKARKAFNKDFNSSEDRRARAHRLIQIGAICEEVYGEPITEGALQDALRKFLREQNSRGGFYSGALNKAKAAPEAANAEGAAGNIQS